MTSTARILGSVGSADGKGVIRVEERFAASIDDVWSALTEPARLAQWYGEVEGELRAGGEFSARVHASGWEGTGRIELCDAPHRFREVSKEPESPDENTTEVTLRAEGDETVIVVDQWGMRVELAWAYAAGMQIHVEDLGAHLAGRGRADASRWEELEPAYRELGADLTP
ncbi:MAG TPA: SRPBCC domain-containing protein [Gaiellaceae bacterium]|nr:SRPBCC domain-containing protein [Gaiellaceae bacterium]